MLDVCVVGHVTRDVNRFAGGTPETRPGGTAYYAALAYRSLGLATGVVTRMRPQDEAELLSELTDRGVRVVSLASRRTTWFENHYYDAHNPDLRRQRLLALADPFQADDAAALPARVVHFGPLMRHDVPAEALRRAAERGARTVLDVQGLVRAPERDRVLPTRWEGDTEWLRWVDVVKADLEEGRLLTGEPELAAQAERLTRCGVAEILITRGCQGSHVFAQGERFDIPALAPRREVDPTGCGDTYAAGYVARRLRSSDAAQCACWGAGLATLKLEARGPVRGDPEQVMARVAELVRDVS